MDLLFTIPDFWPHVRRGSERLVHDLGAELVRRGHRVTVVTRTPSRRPERATMDGMTVRYERDRSAAAKRFGLHPLDGFALTAGLAGIRHRPDVYGAYYLSDAYALHVIGRLQRRPVAVHIMGWPDRAWIERTHPRTFRRIIHAIERNPVTVLSHGAARRAKEEFGVEAEVLVCGTFTETWNRPRPPQERRTIVCSAAVDDPRKRVGLLARAFVQVGREQPDVDLLLVGPGDATAVINEARGADPAVAARVTHRPETRTEELPDILSRCTVGALTSIREAFGLVVVEYLAAGMPAVATDDAGAAEIPTPETGVLFAADDVDACADALRRALTLAEDPKTVDRCRARAAEFDWSRAADAHEAFYARLAAN